VQAQSGETWRLRVRAATGCGRLAAGVACACLATCLQTAARRAAACWRNTTYAACALPCPSRYLQRACCARAPLSRPAPHSHSHYLPSHAANIHGTFSLPFLPTAFPRPSCTCCLYASLTRNPVLSSPSPSILFLILLPWLCPFWHRWGRVAWRGGCRGWRGWAAMGIAATFIAGGVDPIRHASPNPLLFSSGWAARFCSASASLLQTAPATSPCPAGPCCAFACGALCTLNPLPASRRSVLACLPTRWLLPASSMLPWTLTRER